MINKKSRKEAQKGLRQGRWALAAALLGRD